MENTRCIFYDMGIFVYSYVEELIILSDSLHLLKSYKHQLSAMLNLIDLGHPRPFLDLELDQASPVCVEMKHPNITQKLFSKTGLLNLRPLWSSVDESVTYDEAINSVLLLSENHSIYKSIAAVLLYLT